MKRKNTVPHPLPKWVPWAVFFMGVTSVISLRLIIIANHLAPSLIRPLWYIGVCGNALFFVYRFYISRRRQKVIFEKRILEKLAGREELTEEDREALRYLVYSTVVTKEQWNYLVIFSSTIFALLFDWLWPK